MRRTRYWKNRILLMSVALIALAAAGLSGRSTWAQGGETLTYGGNIVGNTTADLPFAIYTINMNEGDTISLLVAGLTPDMLPSVSMVGPNQNPLAVSEVDPFSPAGSHRTRIDYRADQAGAYTVIVTNLNANTPGQFLVMLDGQAATTTTPLEVDAPLVATLPPGSSPAVFSFQLSTAGNLLSVSTSTAGFSFLARVYDGLGRLVAGLAGSDLRGVVLDIGPGSGLYVVEVSALVSSTEGSVQVGLSAGSGGPGAVLPGGDVVVATPTPSVCSVIGANRVNVRSGPSTDYPAIGSLFPGSSLHVTGSNDAVTWFVVDYNGQQGWVASSVTLLGGPCEGLPVVPAPPLPPTATPQPTAFPTATPTFTAPSISFTSTVAEGVTYPPGTCFTFYWNVTNIQAVYFDGQGVPGQGQQQVCPTASRSYTLHVVYPNATTQDVSIPVLIGP
jgi:hypothetical protein